ncbi:MAG: hypothetical protein B6D44_13205 [Ignavibacteriales bacterium UTCHB2]|jgi:hypothetical protein|nr:MAG: hypothetical protein B6D44_13205 [Ignavibacteriales bacterium UTCHB2]
MIKEYKKKFEATSFFLFIFFFILILDFIDIPEISFIIKNIYLFVFLLYNILNYKKNNPDRWLLNPAVLASIFTFLLGFSITNYIHFVPDTEANKFLYKQLGSDPFPMLNYTMTLVILSAMTMWWGYNSKFGDRLYNFLVEKSLGLAKYFRSELKPNMAFIYALIIISVFARLYAIQIGIYGIAQSAKTLSENIAIALLINTAGQLINFSLILMALKFFKEGFNFNYRITLALIVLIEIYFGVISGMKSAVVFPVAILFICYYLVNKKFHKGFIVATILLLVAAYIIVEPFRIIRMQDVNFQSTPGYIASSMMDAYSLNQSRKIISGDDNIITNIVSRSNYLVAAAKAVDYADNTVLDSQAPDFLEKIYTVPLQAFIPRVFWKSKPVEDLGRWFSIVVWGGTPWTSVAMTPIGFLYFTGGVLAIIIGFFVFGVMQRFVWNFYLGGGGQILIYFGFLTTVVLIDSAVNTTLVTWLRNLPVIIILQSFLLKK